MENGRNVTRVAALGDLHCTEASHGILQPLFSQIAEAADVMVLCGDLTDHGLIPQAQTLAKELSTAAHKIPTVAVMGNHDYESGHAAEVRQILTDAGLIILDGEACEVRGIGFAGVKGFGGGFGHQLHGHEPAMHGTKASPRKVHRRPRGPAQLRKHAGR